MPPLSAPPHYFCSPSEFGDVSDDTLAGTSEIKLQSLSNAEYLARFEGATEERKIREAREVMDQMFHHLCTLMQALMERKSEKDDCGLTHL